MEEQDIYVTDVTIARHMKKNNVREYEPSHTSFFRLNKNYRPREYDKTNEVLSLSQS